VRAERLLEEALDEVRNDHSDAIGITEVALGALRIWAGGAPQIDLEGYPWPDEEKDGPACICPPGLVERGGFRSGCPVHA
jgi:hypothetical protein